MDMAHSGHHNAALESIEIELNNNSTSADNNVSTDRPISVDFKSPDNVDRQVSVDSKSSDYMDPQHRHSTEQQDDSEWLEWATTRLRAYSGKKRKISIREFKSALNIRKTFVAERFFHVLEDQNGEVDAGAMVKKLHTFNDGEVDQRLKLLFQLFDVNGDGMIGPDELRSVLIACTEESRVKLDERSIDQLAFSFLEEADSKDGHITQQEMLNVYHKHPEIIENLNISARHLLSSINKPRSRPGYCSSIYMRNNISVLVCIIIYCIINVLLFITCIRYSTSNWCVIIARGCGMCLNFNCALIVVFMLRHALSWLRTTAASAYLPLDHNITFHKAVGIVILILSLIHTAAHLGNIAYVRATPLPDGEQQLAYWEYLFTLRAGVGFVGPGFGYLSGIIVLVMLIVMCLCALPCIRRNGYFEVFYWTHLLYVLFFVFLFLHGPIFHVFALVPGTAFIIEKIGMTLIMRKAKYGNMKIEQVVLLPSKVTHLKIRRPPGFHYHPGDWIFLKVHNIAYFEWHPFTLSSSPDNPDHLWVHVRSAGHWTNKLYEYFDNYEEVIKKQDDVEDPSVSGATHGTIHRINHNRGRSLPAAKRKVFDQKPALTHTSSYGASCPGDIKERAVDIIDKWKKRQTPKLVSVRCSVDGPYGTPTRDIFRTEHCVLIGAGIGVTPFASILQNIMARYKIMKNRCPNCHHSWYGNEANNMKLKKVHFIWINRDQRSFEWFVSLLSQLEIEAQSTEDREFQRFLEMEMYMTSAASHDDIKGLCLQFAMELLRKKQDKDLLTGLRTRTKPGRPDWDEVFSRIEDEKKGKVKVFFCGAQALAQTLHDQCLKRNIDFVKENF